MMSDPFMPLFSVRSGAGFKAADGVYGLTVQKKRHKRITHHGTSSDAFSVRRTGCFMLKNRDCADDERKSRHDDNGKNRPFHRKFLVFINGDPGKPD